MVRRPKAPDLHSVELFHDHNLFLDTKTMYIGSVTIDDDGEGGVDAWMAEQVIKNLHVLDSIDTEAPINIKMNNPGGSVIHGMAIYDAIKECKSIVNITAYGYVMSMGSLIIQAADHRVMMPFAEMMIHEGTDAHGESHPRIIKNWVDYSKKRNQKLNKIYLDKILEKHPNFSRKKLEQWLLFDTIFTAEEALHWGLIDEIGGK